jgi:tryptophanyl-tRNA synthetase
MDSSALSNWVTLQRHSNPEDSLIFSFVGWHALMLPQNPAMLKQSKMDMLATFVGYWH